MTFRSVNDNFIGVYPDNYSNWIEFMHRKFLLAFCLCVFGISIICGCQTSKTSEDLLLKLAGNNQELEKYLKDIHLQRHRKANTIPAKDSHPDLTELLDKKLTEANIVIPKIVHQVWHAWKPGSRPSTIAQA